MCLFDDEDRKIFISPAYNFRFNERTGAFMRWGKDYEDSPSFCPWGPELIDLEISSGKCAGNCRFCYKENSSSLSVKNMSFETFKLIIDRLPNVVCQIAFGITGVQTNPDFIRMLKYCRKKGIVPNFTLSGVDLTNRLAEQIVKQVGGLAVSAYQTDKTVCYATVKIFTDLGVTQTNIHLLIAQENLDFVYEVLTDSKNDERLKKLNAIVFLGVKPKGRAKGHFAPLTSAQYAQLISFCFNRKICFGFDSCSAPQFEKVIKSSSASERWKHQMLMQSESCESGLFSLYVNVKGEAFPCSFNEGEMGWEKGISVLETENFLLDVWNHPRINKWRERLLERYTWDGCRHCPTWRLNASHRET